ncbi:PREDICTED: SKP1-like protein 5 [Camelina sativa]|uniref:SKP1-like protein n=1 Tax=Camelina sativa TaxID=90675 RepID=A0ABM0Z9D7_CAMSA|nr:PREDICTED: SKP1-like protein 5 [Camelina sativa]
MSKKMIELKSSDGVLFTIDEDVATQSQTLKRMVEDDCVKTTVPLENVTSKILKIVIEYCEKHKHVVVSDSSTVLEESKEDLKNWDDEFVKKTEDSILFDVMIAAHYLEIQSLIDLTCQTVADLLSAGKTPEELRAQLDIEKDLTDEEEATIRRENQWAFE